MIPILINIIKTGCAIICRGIFDIAFRGREKLQYIVIVLKTVEVSSV